MKKAVKTIVACVAGAFASVASLAETWTDPATSITWTYTIEGTVAAIGDGTNPVLPADFSGVVDIPAKVGEAELPVAYINPYAFSGCTSLAAVSVPEGVTTIRYNAFDNCSALQDASLPESLEFIGFAAFRNCSSLESITLLQNVSAIGNTAFDGTTALKKVYTASADSARIGQLLEESPRSIDAIEFVEMWTDPGTDITWYYKIADGGAILYKENYRPAISPLPAYGSSVEIPATLGGCPVKSIGHSAFTGCTGMRTVTIPNTVTNIGDHAFYWCSNLRQAVLPGGLESIEQYAFYACYALEIEVPDSVKEIGGHAFFDCKALADENGFIVVCGRLYNQTETPEHLAMTTLAIPGGVVRISAFAFVNSSRMVETVILPQGLEVIGSFAFEQLKYLTKINIPSTVTNIEWCAFYDTPLTNATSAVYVEAGDVERVKGLFAKSGYSQAEIDAIPFYEIFTVTFDANGGTCATATARVVDGDGIGELPEATREGYTQDGWWTEPDGGDPVAADTAITANATFYAHWTKIPDPPAPPAPGGDEPGSGGGSGSGEGFVIIDPSDIRAPYAAAAATTLKGAMYDGGEVAGIVELKLGKVKAKNKTGKVSGSVTGLDGKKHSIASATVTADGTAPATVVLSVKDLGTMKVVIGGTQFAGSLGAYHVQSATVGGDWNKSTATAEVAAGDLSAFAGRVQADLLPFSETAAATKTKWTFRKAAGVKWNKKTSSLAVDTSKGSNLSGLKLTYAAKKGTFKGKFTVYELQGEGDNTKLKKYTVNVTGVVVDGKGTGTAASKKIAVSWPVSVK